MSLQREPVTPRDAYFGYDTKVTAIIESAGKPKISSNATYTGGDAYGKAILIVSQGKQAKRITAATYNQHKPFAVVTNLNENYIPHIDFLVNSRVFPLDATLRLEGTLNVDQNFNALRNGVLKGQRATAAKPFNFIMRGPEQKLELQN